MVASTFFCFRHLDVVVLLAAVACFSCPVDGRSPFLTIQDNGYQNVVVALDPDAPMENAAELVDAIKDLFTQVSVSLHQATRNHLYLAQVTVLLPEEWYNLPDELMYAPASYETYDEADVRVEVSDPTHSDDPSTVRAQGCREPGEYIRLSTNFVTKAVRGSDFSGSAKAFVKEWAQYRYGVFDECGIPGDLVHRTFYYTSRNNSIAPTNCVDVERLAGKFVSCDASQQDKLPHPSCDFQPDLPAPITSSIMYMPYLPEVTAFCDGATHNRLAPTRHNAMCREQSVWDVIRKSDDFLNLEPLAELGEEQKTPTFKILKAVKSSYIIALDTSANVGNSYEATKAAVGSFVDHHVPLHSVLGLVEFNSEVTVKRSLRKITNDKARVTFKNGISVTHSSSGHAANAAEALSTALNVTFADGSHVEPVRPIIIMVTAGKWLMPFSSPDVDELCAAMKAKKARLDVLLLEPILHQDVRMDVQKLTTCTSGSVRLIIGDPSTASNERVTFMQELGAALRESLRASSKVDHVVQLHSYHIPGEETKISGAFQVDGSVGSNTKILVGYDELSTVLDVKVTSPDGVTFENQAEEYVNDVGTKTVGFAFPLVQAGKWTYQITRPEANALPLTVAVTSQARSGNPITVRCWTNVDYRSVSAGNTPVIIYAEVKQGQDAVTKATVKADIELPRIPGSTKQQITATLTDDGSGDPDVNLDDGIYSTYFTTMPEVGFYRIRVRVQGLGHTALRGEKSAHNSKEFFGCRRQTLYSKGTTGFFDRITTASSFYVSKISDLEDPYPPARVADLRLEKVNSFTKAATVAWTAVGDNYYDSQVNSYDIRIDTNREHLQGDDLSLATKPEVNLELQPPRVKQTAEVIIPEHDELFYLALRGMDKLHNAGLSSNIIGILVPKPPPTTQPPVPTITSSPAQRVNDTVDKQKTQTASVGAGAIVGIVIAAVLIVVIVAIVFVVTTKRRREEERRRKEKKYQSIPKVKADYEEEKDKFTDQGGYQPDISHEDGDRRESQTKAVASSNTSV